MGPGWAQRPLMGVFWLHVLWVLLSPVCSFHVLPGWRFTSSEVVIPRKMPHRRGGIKPPNQLTYSIRFRGQKHVIHMKLKKNLMATQFPVLTDNDQGAMQEDYPYVPGDCYYYSYLEGVPGSLATLDTCYGGLRGMLQVDDLTYEIKPLEASSTFEHVVSLLVVEHTSEEDERCKIEEEQIDEVLEQISLAESPRAAPLYLWRMHMKHLKLHYTVTSSVYELNKNISKIIDNIVIINNILDSIYKAVSLHVYIRILCIWQGKDSYRLHRKNKHASDSTHGFGYWKFHAIWTKFKHDNSIIYTANPIGTVKYYASHRGVCNPNWGAGYVYIPNYHIFWAATITAHTIGHGLGLFHDSPHCICFRRHACVMHPKPGLMDVFSNCSFEEIYTRLYGYDDCLSVPNVPYYNFPYESNRCGDKRVTLEEQCDCGSLKECEKDLCCATNCIFTSGSTCNEGTCCENCQFSRAGRVCRDILGICDLPEYCNGTIHTCPQDTYVQDGTPCSPLAVCVRGNCSDRDMQCQALFGYQVKDGAPVCYQQLNTHGDRFGNCGLHTVRSGTIPKPCEADDVLCGMLHCRNVRQVPGAAEHSTFHHILVGETKVESCFGFDTHYGEELPEMGMVVDGATCGPAQYCYNKNCTFHQDLNFDCDVKKCGYKGVCNHLGNCHCLKGWAPPECEQKGAGGSVDSGPPPDAELDVRAKIHVNINKVVAVTLARVAAFLLIILIGVVAKGRTVVAQKKGKGAK